VTDALRVAVLGPGGVGGLLATLLAGQGHEVVCLAGAQTVRALREDGLHLDSRRFGARHERVAAAEVLHAPVDACLVAVKATQLDAALERVPAAVLGDALVVPLLNGVDHVAGLRERYPDARVTAAAIRVESTRIAAGRVHHASPFASVDVAAAPGVDRLARALEGAGLDVRVREGEAAVLWDKMGLLAPLALLTTHATAPAGVVREQRREDLLAVVAEVAAVARAEGAAGDEAAVLATIDALPPTMRSSMQRDAEAGRPIELDALGGAVLRAAARHGLQAPVTARLVGELAGR
jgi:2-dehydropantoate 2-reductase